jgi:hypothetical protein
MSGEVRQIQPLSRVPDTLDTKARICKEMVMKLGGLLYGDDRSPNRRARRKTIRDTEETLHIRHATA